MKHLSVFHQSFLLNEPVFSLFEINIKKIAFENKEHNENMSLYFIETLHKQ